MNHAPAVLRRLARTLEGPAGSRPVVFITASDTDAGKTWLATALLREWRRRGVAAVGIKAVGCGGHGDARALARASAPGWTLAAADPVFLPLPLAPANQPHPPWAAMLRRIRGSLRAAGTAGARVILVEGAGGLLCPVDGPRTMRDLAAALGAALLVVVPNHLGALNQALLVLEAAGKMRLRVAALVLNGGAPRRRAPIRSGLRRSNAHLLRHLTRAPVVEVG
jgi:dethiobiotin synthetase